MARRPRRPIRPVDPNKYRQPRERTREDRKFEQRGFLTDMFRGYLYFSNRASCYIVAGCVAIFGPLCTCIAVVYWVYLR